MFRKYTDLTPVAYEQISVTTAVGFTQATCIPTTGTPANVAVVRVSGANIRWRDDGTNPTTTVGMPINAGETFDYDGNLKKIMFIAQSGTATLDVSYYNAN